MVHLFPEMDGRREGRRLSFATLGFHEAAGSRSPSDRHLSSLPRSTSHLLAQASPKPHRHATKTMTNASYAPDFFIDTHADTTQRMLDEHYDLTEPLNGGHVNFEAAKQGQAGRGVLLHLGGAAVSTRVITRGARWS